MQPAIKPRTIEEAESQTNIVWQPIPDSSQELALDTRAHITLYTGARGPGKTDTQLMRFRRNVGKGYGAFWRGIIFDREYKNLEDIITKSKRWFPAFNDGVKFLESASSLKWVWPTGEELLFRVAEKPSDYWKYHGHEYPFIGWNELTKYPNLELFDMMMSCNRSSYRPEDYPLTIDGDVLNATGQIVILNERAKNGVRHYLPQIPLEVFATCNPYGVGHNAVKHRFISPAPYGQVVRTEVEVWSPKTKQKEKVVRSQVAIFGSYIENIYLSVEYVAVLEGEKDKNRRKAWLTGSWDIVAGGAFDDVWSAPHNVIPRFDIPETWRIDRSFDWGSSHPFWVGWWAEANGEEATLPDGSKFCPPVGSLICIFEWYGTAELGTNKGLKLSAKSVATGIKTREIEMMESGFIATQPWPGPADNQIRDVREQDVDTIEIKMAKEGVRWTESDKSPGSRRNGMQLVRDMLDNARTGEGPGLYFMEHCRAVISILPTLPRDEDKLDDVDTDAEDHPYDAVRYRILRGSNRYATAVKVSFSR